MAKSRFKSRQKGTPEFKRRQARRAKLKKVVDPLAGEVDAAANLKFGDAERSLQSEGRISDAVSAQIPGFFAQYQQRLKDITGAQQQGYAQAQQDLQAQADQSRASQQNAVPQAQQQANVTGGTVDPAAQNRQAGVQSRAVPDIYGGLLRTNQANAGNYGLEKQRIGEGEQINQLLKERGRKKEIGTKLTDLAKDKGDYKVQARESLIEQRHKRILERKAFGLKVSQAEQDALDTAIKQQNEQARIGIGQQNADTSAGRRTDAQKKDDYQRQNKLGPYKPASKGATGKKGSTATRNTARKNLANLISDGTDVVGSPELNKQMKKRKLTRTEALSVYLKSTSKETWLAKAAAEYITTGNLSADTRKKLKSLYGISGPGNTVHRKKS